MAGNNHINIKINIRQGDISFTKDENTAPPSPFDTGDNDSAANNIRVELGIAKVFHKVLNLIKADPDLFQKEDFELLGEMLAKILFGKINNNDFRNYIMKEVEQTLEINNPTGKKICRIFLEFDQKSGVAMLPWEYTLYKTRSTKEPKLLYISANTKSRFNLMRRVKENPCPDPEADKLFIMVIINVDGNKDAIPQIDNRTGDLAKIKNSFKALQDAYPDKLVIEYIEGIPFNKLKQRVEDIYKNWERQYQQTPCYALHYLGHAILEGQVGKLVVKNPESNKSDWIEDKKFASLFGDVMLNVAQPSLVCFQACDSAKIGSYNDTLRGVAYEFTKINIPAVIGMQNEINTATSCAFFEKFYENILSGKDVAEAVTAGRDYLGREFNIESEAYINNSFGSPVLFITTEEPIQLLKSAISRKTEEITTESRQDFTFNTRPSEMNERASVRPKEGEGLNIAVANLQNDTDKIQRSPLNQNLVQNNIVAEKIIDVRDATAPNVSPNQP